MTDDRLQAPTRPIRAAQYVRMSTEHQSYSIANQASAIAQYAAARGYEIVRTYADAGVSGLALRGRAALRALLADVTGGAADYAVVLVYDVSRWGRFQDPDQGAHYEFLCRESGIPVEYCAELFANDGTLGATLLKQLKRAMAAEYSRELSVKVSCGKRRIAGLGFWVGGPAGYGLRRQAVSATGVAGPVLQRGQGKATTDRVVLVPGPAEEVATVRRIFSLFVVGGLSRAEVARTLNRQGSEPEPGAPWTPHRVHEVLTNEKYIGANILGRATTRLGAPLTRHPREAWVMAPDAFRPLVATSMFEAAQRHIRGRNLRLDDERLLADLKTLLRTHGRLTAAIISAAEGVACACVYRRRFGGLIQAYALVGYQASHRQRLLGQVQHPRRLRRHLAWLGSRSDEEMIGDLARLYARLGRLTVREINDAPETDHADAYRRRFGGMRRAYALAGYTPSEEQERAFDSRGGQSLDRAAAAELARRVAAGPDP